MIGVMPCPCGKCIPCLINRKRLWKHRLILESYCHDKSAFVTLTYNDDQLYYRNDKTGEELVFSPLSVPLTSANSLNAYELQLVHRASASMLLENMGIEPNVPIIILLYSDMNPAGAEQPVKIPILQDFLVVPPVT